MDYWKTKLTPFDAELCKMVESLTDAPCEPKNAGDHYFIQVDYKKHNDPQYILAIWDAIEGRAGERLIEIKDDPELSCLWVRIRFSKEKYPGLIYMDRNANEMPDVGQKYCRQMAEIRALMVNRENAGRLLQFVGNGEMETSQDQPAVFHFLNASQSVWEHAVESSYIVYVKPGLFNVVDKETFEFEYEPK